MTRLRRLQVVAWTLLLAVAFSTALMPQGTARVSAAEEQENTAANLAQEAVDFILEKYEEGEELDPYTVYALAREGEVLDDAPWSGRNGSVWSVKDEMKNLAAGLGEEQGLVSYLLSTQNADGSFGPYANVYGTKAPLQALALVGQGESAVEEAVEHIRTRYEGGELSYALDGFDLDYRYIEALVQAGENLDLWVREGEEETLAGDALASAAEMLEGNLAEVETVTLAKQLAVLTALDPDHDRFDELATEIVGRQAVDGRFADSIYDHVMVLTALGGAERLDGVDQEKALDYINGFKQKHENMWGDEAGAAWGGWEPKESDLSAQVLTALSYFDNRPEVSNNIQEGLAYLADIQDPSTAGIPHGFDATFATAEVLIALNALGENYGDWTKVSGTKTVAQTLLALVGLGEDGEEADRLANILLDRHDEENSFENSVYSDFWAYLALAEAGKLGDLDRAKVVDYILGKQADDGSWGETFDGIYYPDFLVTTEAIRVLHRLDIEGTDDDIQAGIQAGLVHLKDFRQEDGGVYYNNGWDDPVVDTAALVITLLELEEDPTDWSVEEGEANPVIYLQTEAYNEEDGSFGTSRNILGSAYALQAYTLLQDAGLGDSTGGDGSGGNGTPPGSGDGSGDQEQDYEVEVKVVGKKGETLFGTRTVTISDDNPWGKTALGALHATGLSYVVDGGFVRSVAGQANAGMSGWMYQVNGVSPAVAASEKELKAGDRVLWWYSTDPSDIPSWFDDPELKPVEETGLDRKLTEALTDAAAGDDIIVTLEEDDGGLQAVFSAAKIKDLVEKQMTLVFQGPDPADPVLIIPGAALETQAVEEALAEDAASEIRLGCRRLPAAEQEGLAEEWTRLEQKGLYQVGDEVYRLEATIGEEPLPFSEGITVRFPLAADNFPAREDINYIGVYRLPAVAGGEEEYVPSIPVYEEGGDRWYIEARLDRFSLFTLLRSRATFADLEGHWAREAVELMVARNVIAGMSELEFAPDLPVTRAQLVAMLVKALGLEPVVPDEPTFQDVEAGSWYYAPVETALQAGLAAGRDNSEFDPAASVTRQEMAVLLARALEIHSGRATDSYQVEANLLRFNDRDTIAPWAEGAAARVVQERLMTGMPGRLFAPRGTATRAQAAVVLKNILLDMGKLV